MKKIYIAAVLALSLAACHNKENLSSESVLKPRTTAKTALDTYIYNNFQQPYNIMVTYNYIDCDFDLGKKYYAATEASVRAVVVMGSSWCRQWVRERAGAGRSGAQAAWWRETSSR